MEYHPDVGIFCYEKPAIWTDIANLQVRTQVTVLKNILDHNKYIQLLCCFFQKHNKASGD